MTSNRLNRNQRRTFKLLPGANSHVVNLERPLPLRENVCSVSSSPEAYGQCLEEKTNSKMLRPHSADFKLTSY